MWIIFKVFIEFVTTLLLLFLFWTFGPKTFGILARDQTCILWNWKAKSYLLDHQGNLLLAVSLRSLREAGSRNTRSTRWKARPPPVCAHGCCTGNRSWIGPSPDPGGHCHSQYRGAWSVPQFCLDKRGILHAALKHKLSQGLLVALHSWRTSALRLVHRYSPSPCAEHWP